MTPCEKCNKNVSLININTIVKSEFIDGVYIDVDIDLCDDCFKKYEESRQEQLIAVHSRPIRRKNHDRK